MIDFAWLANVNWLAVLCVSGSLFMLLLFVSMLKIAEAADKVAQAKWLVRHTERRDDRD